MRSDDADVLILQWRVMSFSRCLQGWDSMRPLFDQQRRLFRHSLLPVNPRVGEIVDSRGIRLLTPQDPQRNDVRDRVQPTLILGRWLEGWFGRTREKCWRAVRSETQGPGKSQGVERARGDSNALRLSRCLQLPLYYQGRIAEGTLVSLGETRNGPRLHLRGCRRLASSCLRPSGL